MNRLTALFLTLCALAAVSCGRSGTPPPDNTPDPVDTPVAPRIVSIAGENTREIAVTVADDNGDDVTITATPPSGLRASEQSQVVADGAGTATFRFSAEDVFVGGGGSVSIAISDGLHTVEPRAVAVDAPPIEYVDDTLYAMPLQGSVKVGEPVTILVATGKLDALKFLTGVRVTCSENWRYVPDSFNVGDVGGAKDAADGAWTDMLDETFLLMPDNFIDESELSGGRSALDFNVTPITDGDIGNGPALVDAYGALFNFQVTFTQAGTYTLRFEERNVVPRTYYMNRRAQEGESDIDQFWGDVSNDYDGVPNTIEVAPGDGSEPNPEPTEDENGWNAVTNAVFDDLSFSVQAGPQCVGEPGDLSLEFSKFDTTAWEYGGDPEDLRRIVEVRINAANADDLKLLFCTIFFDSGNLTSMQPIPGDDLAGLVSVGQFGYDHFTNEDWHCITTANGLMNYDEAAGLTGSGNVLKYYFMVKDAEYTSAPPSTPAPTAAYTLPGAYMPPSDPTTASTMTYDAVNGKLVWDYNNLGDFNQDGLANLYDWDALTRSIGDVAAGADSLAGFIMNDPSGTVNVAAITQLGRNFNSQVTTYNVYSGTYPDGPSALLGTVDFAEAVGAPATERLHFEFALASPSAGTSYWVKPFHNTFEGAASTAYTH